MVLGDELHTGGVPPKTDILAKRLNLLRTLSEHIQEIGVLVSLQSTVVSTTTTETFYTVPANKVAYVQFLTHTISNEDANDFNSIIAIDTAGGTGDISRINVVGLDSHTVSLVFNPMFKLNAGQQLVLRQGNGVTANVTKAAAYGVLHELDREIAVYPVTWI